jgi:hypothetical protein
MIFFVDAADDDVVQVAKRPFRAFQDGVHRSLENGWSGVLCLATAVEVG